MQVYYFIVKKCGEISKYLKACLKLLLISVKRKGISEYIYGITYYDRFLNRYAVLICVIP